MDWLQETHHLYNKQTITHRYPYDWRAKTPVIFRLTPQWFIHTKQLVQNQHILEALQVVVEVLLYAECEYDPSVLSSATVGYDF